MGNDMDAIVITFLYVIVVLCVGLIVEFLLRSRESIALRSLRGFAFAWSILYGAYIFLTFHPYLQTVPLGWLQKAITITVVVSIVVLSQRVAGHAMNAYTKKYHRVESTIISNIIRGLIYVVGGFIVLELLGIAIAPFLTALGVGGFAVALGLQDTLRNIFSGIFLITSRKIRIGDYINVDTKEGRVTDINWRNTVLKEPNGNSVYIPNAIIANAVVTQYSAQNKTCVRVVCTVSNGADVSVVEKIAKKVAAEVQKEISDVAIAHEPVVQFEELSKNGLSFALIFYVRDITKQFDIRHASIKRLHTLLKKEGIALQ